MIGKLSVFVVLSAALLAPVPAKSANVYWSSKRGCLLHQAELENILNAFTASYAATRLGMLEKPMAVHSDKSSKLFEIEEKFRRDMGEYQQFVKSFCEAVYP